MSSTCLPYSMSTFPGKLALACLAVAVCARVGFAAEVSPEDAQTLQAAQKAYDGAKYADAVKLLLPLRTKYPDEGDIPRMLTHAYFELGEFDAARDAALTAIGAGRLAPDVLGRIAQIDQRRDDRLALVNVVRLLTVLEPANRQWRLVYADLLAATDALDESVGVYRALLAEVPESANVALRLGSVLVKQERHAEAAAMLETAWHLGANDPRLPTTLAGIHQQLGDDRQTLAWLERATANAEAVSPERQMQLGHLLWKLGEHDRAAAAVEDLAKSGEAKFKSQAHMLLGRIAMDRQRVEEAIAHWQTAAASGEPGTDLLAVLGAHYFNTGDFATAAKVLRRVVEAEKSENEQHLRFLVLSLFRAGDTAAARGFLRQYVERHGMSEEAQSLVRAIAAARPDARPAAKS
ncbi:MAG: hypothetical protein DCC68_00255 [Planctomycetota bacterium]|nr:MAG: hypothetical protein DCC68_00255 [Planctomycetota bacterium]